MDAMQISGTEHDIKRGKTLVMFNSLKYIFESRKVVPL